jgi:hypothetical protein
MTRSRNLCIPATLLAAALAASCATAEVPGGGGEGQGDLVDGGQDEIRPTSDAGGTGLDGGSCPTQPCDLHEQCGCGAVEACDLDFTNFDENEFSDQLACRPIDTPGNELSTCSSASRCGAGYQCIGGQCRRYCQNSDVCGGPGGRCVLTRLGSERTDDGLCTKSCLPDYESDTTEGCPKDYSCYIRLIGSDDDRFGVTDCLPTGPVGVGGDCSNEGCGEGLLCVVFTDAEGNQSRRCQHRCRVGDQECPGDAECEGFDPPTTMEGTEYGFCRT